MWGNWRRLREKEEVKRKKKNKRRRRGDGGGVGGHTSGYAHLEYWEGGGASHLHAQQQVSTRVCTSGSLRAFTSGGFLGHSWGEGRLFHTHLGHQGSPGCSYVGGLGSLGDAAAFRPTAGEVAHVTAGHTAEGTGMLKHIWRTRWFLVVHIWRHKVSAHLESLPTLAFPHSELC